MLAAARSGEGDERRNGARGDHQHDGDHPLPQALARPVVDGVPRDEAGEGVAFSPVSTDCAALSRPLLMVKTITV